MCIFLGIDHFLALECFHDVQNSGGKIESFVSFCGGLPAPEASDNALGYKFSWSPRGALLNMLSGGRLFCKSKSVKLILIKKYLQLEIKTIYKTAIRI